MSTDAAGGGPGSPFSWPVIGGSDGTAALCAESTLAVPPQAASNRTSTTNPRRRPTIRKRAGTPPPRLSAGEGQGGGPAGNPRLSAGEGQGGGPVSQISMSREGIAFTITVRPICG